MTTQALAMICCLAGIVPGAQGGNLTKVAEKPEIVLPYDNTNPVMYDNDWTNDYVDWYLMALASARDINYRGISTSSETRNLSE